MARDLLWSPKCQSGPVTMLSLAKVLYGMTRPARDRAPRAAALAVMLGASTLLGGCPHPTDVRLVCDDVGYVVAMFVAARDSVTGNLVPDITLVARQGTVVDSVRTSNPTALPFKSGTVDISITRATYLPWRQQVAVSFPSDQCHTYPQRVNALLQKVPGSLTPQ